MKLNTNPIMVLFGIILATLGVLSFLGYRFMPTTREITIAVLVLAGLIIFLVLFGKSNANVGMLLVAIWLIMMGMIRLYGLSFVYRDLIMSALPLVAGFFTLIGV